MYSQSGEGKRVKRKVRPNIGFFTCHLDNDYAFEICKGVEYAAEEADVNLTIFPGMYLNASYNDPVNAKYDYQYNSIFYYASQKSLDALIVCIGSIGSFISVDDKKSFLDAFDVPVLTLEIEVPGYPCLYTEGKTGMRQIVEHLVKDHKKTKIGFVSGRLENSDALERLTIYKDVLEENGIPYDESKVVYGNFSEYTEDIVDELLDRHNDLEALIFANDTMAIGGYTAIKRRGLVIGKDILVTGYDNAPYSLSLSPALTTVDNNIMDLGYQSIFQALELLDTGTTSKSVLHSQMVSRFSCGLDPASDPAILKTVNATLADSSPEDLMNFFKTEFMSQYTDIFYSRQLFALMDPFLLTFTRMVFSDDPVDVSLVREDLGKILANDIIRYYFSTINVIFFVDLLSRFLTNLDISQERRSRLADIFNTILSSLSYFTARRMMEENRDHKESAWSSNYITRDTLLTATDDYKCFHLIMDKLENNIGFPSAFIYLYDEVPVELTTGLWQIPKYLLIQAYYQDGRIHVLRGDNRIMPSYMVLKPKSDVNRRRTMVLTPIFTNEVQHGLFLCEADLPNFKSIYSTSLQLGTSMKFIALMKQELSIQNRLEATMNEIREKNDLLNALSVTDELTGLMNRRGFFEAAQQYTNARANRGIHSLAAYIDMDNLKQVNDIFGHKDGDYALRSIAKILRSSFPGNSIIARIGGDEFAVFVPSIQDGDDEKFTMTLNNSMEQLNRTCDKPYYIEFSFGFTDFTCSDKIHVEDDMTLADEKLYLNKKSKRKNVRKDAQE